MSYSELCECGAEVYPGQKGVDHVGQVVHCMYTCGTVWDKKRGTTYTANCVKNQLDKIVEELSKPKTRARKKVEDD